MNVNALRAWGIAVSAALMAIALAISLQSPRSGEAEYLASPQAVVPAEAPLQFIVRFRGSGPIARAQARAERGDVSRAQREVEHQLRRQGAFAGLCFERFTVGGAEIVLRTCDIIAQSEHRAVQERWLRRLRAMRAVEYADANVTATPGRAPG